jgi:hypothetical protein
MTDPNSARTQRWQYYTHPQTGELDLLRCAPPVEGSRVDGHFNQPCPIDPPRFTTEEGLPRNEAGAPFKGLKIWWPGRELNLDASFLKPASLAAILTRSKALTGIFPLVFSEESRPKCSQNFHLD